MAVIHRRQKWAYLVEPYTASRATQRLLLKIGAQKSGAHHDGVSQMKQRFRDFPQWDIAVTVRNPIDTLVTRYIKNNHENLSFDDWVVANRITTPLSGVYNGCNTYCWYEQLQDDLRFMFHRNSSNWDDFTLDYLEVDKTAGKKPWWTYPSEATLNILLGHFKSFMDTFGYVFYRDGGEPRMGIRPEVVYKRCRALRYHKP